VRFQTTPAFDSDFSRLSGNEKQLFKRSVRLFNDACDRFVETGGSTSWPSSLRVKKVQGAPRVLEMTWSFAGPDGRATWEWSHVEVEGEQHTAVLWRRVGNHSILRDP